MEVLLCREAGGGFRLSKKAYECLGVEWDEHGFLGFHKLIPDKKYEEIIEEEGELTVKAINILKRLFRTDKRMINCFKRLGKKMEYDGDGVLKVIEVPEEWGDNWHIIERETGYEEVVKGITRV